MTNLTIRTTLFEYGYEHGVESVSNFKKDTPPRFPNDPEYMKGYQLGFSDTLKLIRENENYEGAVSLKEVHQKLNIIDI